MQLYMFYHKNINNLLPSYFNSVTPYYNNENHNHDLRYSGGLGLKSHSVICQKGLCYFS